jgi:hypothetical protein
MCESGRELGSGGCEGQSLGACMREGANRTEGGVEGGGVCDATSPIYQGQGTCAWLRCGHARCSGRTGHVSSCDLCCG